MDGDGQLVKYNIERQMPWDVGCKTKNTRIYKTLDKAVERFMNLAWLLDPK
jgi:hypothetical protein